MIELFKLTGLPNTQKIRKIIKILELLETECLTVQSDASAQSLVLSYDTFYIEGLCAHLESVYPSDPIITDSVKTFTTVLHNNTGTAGAYRKLFNTLRHALYRQSGVKPSEWDLIAPGIHYGMHAPNERSPQAGTAFTTAQVLRPFYKDVFVYAEDIRAPFNLGSIFRTAEAFGAAKILLSEHCVSPEQPRAQRSAMGCINFLPWAYCALEALPAHLPVFALETGGCPITSFSFPMQGIVLLGSEELGLSAEALKKVSAGVVSIPMKGIKASLNVAVAFGILMQYWSASLSC